MEPYTIQLIDRVFERRFNGFDSLPNKWWSTSP